MLKLGTLYTYFNNAEFMTHCVELSKKYKSNNRTDLEKLRHTTFGEAVEQLCSTELNLQQTAFSTSEYDAVKNNQKIEIKHTTKNSKWWSFKLDSYKFFVQNSQSLNYIFLCYVDAESICYLKYIAEAKTFKNYIKESNFKDYYYNVDRAILDQQCFEIFNISDLPENLK